ncbi:MAG: DUF3102 domain-containing protein [Clostridia bacterium]|nr:DUF3102 domain-containing protein [Clostridia bacterium]
MTQATFFDTTTAGTDAGTLIPQEAHALSTRTAEEIAEHINLVKARARSMIMTYAIEIGADLIEAKGIVPHGHWGEWLRDNVEYSERQAQQLMQVAKEYGTADVKFLEQISLSQAVAMVALPQADREKLVEEHGDGSVRELEEAVKALKAERASLQVSIDEITKEKADAEQEHLSKVEAMQAGMDQLRAQLSQLMEQVAEPAGPSSEEMDRLTEAVRKAESEKADLMEQIKAQRDAYEAKLSAYADDISDSQKDAERSVELAQEEMEKQKAEYDKRVQALQEQLSQKEDELKEARAGGTAADTLEIKFRAAFDGWQASTATLLGALAQLGTEKKAKYRMATSKAMEIVAGKLTGV